MSIGQRGRAIILVVALALALVPSQVLAQDGSPPSITTGDPEADRIIGLIEQMVDDATVARSELRSGYLDLGVLLESIGQDPYDITRWVAEETRWLPYEGALRGARGVLMDRTGNSLDRALLLAELLARQGVEARLASAQLPVETAAAVIESGHLTSGTPPQVEAVFADPEEVAGYRASVESSAAELADAVGLLEPQSDPANAQDLAADLVQHWWVQASIDGAWVDMDPVLASTDVERPVPERTFDPAEVPVDLRHGATIRVVVERAEGDALVEAVPLAHAIQFGGDEPLVEMELGFDVGVSPDDAERAAATTDVAEAARLASHWRPVLRLEDGVERGDWFSSAGLLEGPGALLGADALSGAASALSGLGSGPDDERSADSRLTAAWIEYETFGPGTDPQIERRELLDLLEGARSDAQIDGPVPTTVDEPLQRGLAFLGDTAMLVQAASTHPDAALAALLDSVISMRSALIAQVFVQAGVDDERIGPSLASAEYRPFDLLAMTAARDRWSGTTDTYLAGPNIWTRHSFYASGPDGPQAIAATDVTINDMAVVPEAVRDPRLVRLEQGILDTLVEHALASTDGSFNTWARFVERSGDGTDWTPLLPASTLPDEVRTALPAADAARVQSALEDGSAVVLAVDPRSLLGRPFSDWWRIDADGSTLGMGFRGWGQDVAEEADVTTEISIKSLQPLLQQDKNRWYLRHLREAIDYWRKNPIRTSVDAFAETGEYWTPLLQFFLF